MYSSFNKMSDFETVFNYANKFKYVLWHDKGQGIMVVTEEGHAMVKAYVKSRSANKSGAQPAPGSRTAR
ncbi:hypothetical protein EV182_002817 [Spiromyces aspiralis]|uniref:Uncharacterized protein n=1 Tax=Spiromyces aspiralis TaxID=68401 RepID=A0ACC1HRZ0_9FUNG|nr:hypothetical protein EV182_002817 [Spiromyces aspiralis]